MNFLVFFLFFLCAYLRQRTSCRTVGLPASHRSRVGALSRSVMLIAEINTVVLVELSHHYLADGRLDLRRAYLLFVPLDGKERPLFTTLKA